MAKGSAQLHTSALSSYMHQNQIYKTEFLHRGHRNSSSPRCVNHHLIKKANKTPSTSLGKKERQKKLTSSAVSLLDAQTSVVCNAIKYRYVQNIHSNLLITYTYSHLPKPLLKLLCYIGS